MPAGGGAAAARATAMKTMKSWRWTPLILQWSSCTRSGAEQWGRAVWPAVLGQQSGQRVSSITYWWACAAALLPCL